MINVAIIDYGTGNIASLFSALKAINTNPYLGDSLINIKKADALILPGVGHYGHALNNLKRKSLVEPIVKLIKDGLPTLGICLGFQILTLSSQESDQDKGLGLLPLKTIRLKQEFPKIYKIPHIGWNCISYQNKESKLLKGIPKDENLIFLINIKLSIFLFKLSISQFVFL